jgi:hypothetical protein
MHFPKYQSTCHFTNLVIAGLTGIMLSKFELPNDHDFRKLRK